MKILLLFGSPNLNGSSRILADNFIQGAKEAGHSVSMLDIAHANIHPCAGCLHCGYEGPCIQKDDIQEIVHLIRKCQIVILAAPVYWANVPAPVKNLFDRLLGAAIEETNTFPKPHLQGKKYLLLTSCNTPFPFSWIFGQSKGAIHNMNEFFKTAGMKSIGKIVCAGAANKQELPKQTVKKIERCLK